MKGEIDVLRIFIKVFISYHIIKKVEKWVELEEWWKCKCNHILVKLGVNEGLVERT